MKRFKDRFFNGVTAAPKSSNDESSKNTENVANIYNGDCYTPINTTDAARQSTIENDCGIGATNQQLKLDRSKINGVNLAKNGPFKSQQNGSQAVVNSSNNSSSKIGKTDSLIYCSPTITKSKSLQFKDISGEKCETIPDQKARKALPKTSPKKSQTDPQQKHENLSKLGPLKNTELTSKHSSFEKPKNSRHNFTKTGKISSTTGNSGRKMDAPLKVTVQRYSTFDEITSNLGSQDFLSHAVLSVNQRTKGKLPGGGENNGCQVTMENSPSVGSAKEEKLPGKYGKGLGKGGKEEFKDVFDGQKSVNKFNLPGFLGENDGSEKRGGKEPQRSVVSSVADYPSAVGKDGKDDARGRKKEEFLENYEQTRTQSYSDKQPNFLSRNKSECIADTSVYGRDFYNNNSKFSAGLDFVHVGIGQNEENVLQSNLEAENAKQINYHYNNSRAEPTHGFSQQAVKILTKEEPQISRANSDRIPSETEKISPFYSSAFSRSSQPYDSTRNTYRQNRPMVNTANNECSSTFSNGIENSVFHNNGLNSHGEIHGNNTYAATTISKRELAAKELHIPFCERTTNVSNTNNDSYNSQQLHNRPTSIEKYSPNTSAPISTVSYNNTTHQNTHSNPYTTLVGNRHFGENRGKQNSSNPTSGNSKIDHSPTGANSRKNKSSNSALRKSRELLLPHNNSGKNPSSSSTINAGETKNNKASWENSGNNNTGTFSRNWSFKAASRSAESQTDLSLIEPKYKDASTNTEITLIPPDQKTQQSKSPSTTKENLPGYDLVNNSEDISYNQDTQHTKPASADAATELALAVDKLARYYSVPTSGGYLNRSLSSLYPSGHARLVPGSAGDPTGTNQVQLRNPARRDWSSRHYAKERPQSFSETLSYNVRRNPECILGRGRNSRIYASTNQGRLVTPNTSRYALSSRASSTDRFLDSKYGEVEPAPFLEKGSNFEDLLDSENTFNVSQNFFSASEGSLLDDDSATADSRPSTTTRRNQERVTRLKDHSSSAEPTNRADSLNARFFPNNNFNQNRARSSSNDGLLRQVSSAQSRIRSTTVKTAESFGSGRGLNDHKYHKSECDLIDDCECRTIPRLKKEARTRTVGNVCNQSGPKMSHFPEFFNEQLPKSKSTSGSIFLKQVVEPSKAFAYLTSIETLADASDNNASSDKLGSHGKIQDKLYEPLCQNCGLKGHSILKCDKISRVDKLYDVIMLGDRVTITHNEPNYVRSQKNKLPRCYHCGLKGHRSRSCSKLAPQAKAELDPFETNDPQFNAFTIPRSSRRARSEVRSAYEDAGFSIPAPDYSISNNSGLLSPMSTDTALTFSNHSTMTSHHLRPYDDGRSSGYHNQFSTNTTSSIKTPNVDVFCSDVDYGYDSSGVGFARPISMFETTMPPQRPAGLHINGNATDTGIDSSSGTDKARPQSSSKIYSGIKQKLTATESNPNVLTSSSKDQFQKRNTVDFDDRDSGIGYGETSSQTNLETIPRTPVNSGHNVLGHNERPIDAPDILTKGVQENPDQASPSIDSEKSEPGSDGAKSKAAKPKKKNPILRKIACITGNKNTAQ